MDSSLQTELYNESHRQEKVISENLLGIFIKYPQANRVKTRLSAAVGPQRSAEISRQLAEITMQKTAPHGKSSYNRAVFIHTRKDDNAFRKWFPEQNLFYPQSGKDLGQRMMHAFQSALEAKHKKVIIIGSDCPDISFELICTAFNQLDKNDVVIGPAFDGGYYLIGMKKVIPEIFTEISWSTPHVLKQTLSRLRHFDHSHALLPVLRDIDRIDDLNYYRGKDLLI